MSGRKESSTKDPIRDAPLRDPGQSLRESLDDLLVDVAFPWFATAILAAVMAAIEWWRWWSASPPAPKSLTLIAFVIAGIAAWKWRAVKAEAARIKTGLKGERATGQLLQSGLLPLGYEVFHDCCFDDFNVDHVAIGPGGIFAIETKTRTKPSGDARVTYDGRQVLVNGLAPDRDPVAQARAGASRIGEILAEYAGIQTQVRPVVLFPGWFVEGRSTGAETWVLNPKAFMVWVERESPRLSPEQIRVLAAGLARYIRCRLEHDAID